MQGDVILVHYDTPIQEIQPTSIYGSRHENSIIVLIICVKNLKIYLDQVYGRYTVQKLPKFCRVFADNLHQSSVILVASFRVGYIFTLGLQLPTAYVSCEIACVWIWSASIHIKFGYSVLCPSPWIRTWGPRKATGTFVFDLEPFSGLEASTVRKLASVTDETVVFRSINF